jgi:hypothetical protein
VVVTRIKMRLEVKCPQPHRLGLGLRYHPHQACQLLGQPKSTLLLQANKRPTLEGREVTQAEKAEKAEKVETVVATMAGSMSMLE